MRNRVSRTFLTATFVFLTALGVRAQRAEAAGEQLVAFDEVFKIVAKGDGGLEPYHHLIKKQNEPSSWTTPVAYYKGTAYLYLEVLQKPSARQTILTICFDGDRSAYGCIDTNTYTAKGVVKTMSPMAEGGLFWQYDQIAWTKARGQYHVVVKDPTKGGSAGGTPATDFAPTDVRLVLTIVPPGGTYVEPMPSAGGADGGTTSPTDGGAAGGSGGSVGGDAGGASAGAGGNTGGSATGGSGGNAGGASGSSSGSEGGTSGGAGGSQTGGSSGSVGGTSGSPSGSSSGGKAGSSNAGSAGGASSGSSDGSASGCSFVPAGGSGDSTAGLILLVGFAIGARLRRRRRD